MSLIGKTVIAKNVENVELEVYIEDVILVVIGTPNGAASHTRYLCTSLATGNCKMLAPENIVRIKKKL